MSSEQRPYERSHPWLTFTIHPYMSKAPGKMWWLLGRICGLIENMGQTPLRPDLARDLHMVYMVKGAQATTAIEGNTLTEQQVREVIEKNTTLKPSKEYLAQEIRNVVSGFDVIVLDLAQGHKPVLSPEVVAEMNSKVLAHLEVDEGVIPGRYREHSVHVGHYLAPPASDVDYLVKRMCDWLNGPELGDELHESIIKAIVAHLYLEWIHPFGDGNGRTGRLLEFQILVTNGLPTAVVHLLSNHYNQTRSEYYRQLDRASRSGGDFLPFVLYALQGLLDGLEEQYELIRDDLERLVWRDHVDGKLGAAAAGQTRTEQRRRALACALFDHAAPLSLGEILRVLPDMVPWYDDKTTKTLTRDLNAMLELRLVEKRKSKWRARTEIVLGLRPDVEGLLDT